MKIDELAHAIFDLANADFRWSVVFLPSWASIKEEVSGAVALLETEDFRVEEKKFFTHFALLRALGNA